MRNLVCFFMAAILMAGVSGCNGKPDQKKGDCPRDHKMDQKMDHKKDCKGKDCFIPNITEEQKTQIKGLKDKQMAEAAPLMESLKAKKEQMCELMKAEPVDLNAVNALIDETFVIKANLEKLEVANRFEMMKLLTPEQKAAMKEKPCCKKEGGCCKDGEHKEGGCCKDGEHKEGGCCKDGDHKGGDKGCCEGDKGGKHDCKKGHDKPEPPQK